MFIKAFMEDDYCKLDINLDEDKDFELTLFNYEINYVLHLYKKNAHNFYNKLKKLLED